MEHRIKTLYIITIIAIISFLAMQIYWLYGRYEFSLREYERQLASQILKSIEGYNDVRSHSGKLTAQAMKMPGEEELVIPRFSLRQVYGDTVKTSRTAKVFTYRFSAYEILGLDPGTPLTEEMKNKAMRIASTNLMQPADSVVYDASGAKDENEAWGATRNLQTEREHPFSTEGLDSVLSKAGIAARISLNRADTMVWRDTMVYDASIFRPRVAVTSPYSQLEGKTVTVAASINPFDILPGMWQTLLLSLIVSVLLIVCLVLQFATVLKLSRLDKMRNSFITTMIHELKRPLSTLKMCVSGLDNPRMSEDAEVKAELMGASRNALDNLSAYFSKLRDITFNDVEQIPLNIQPLNVHDLFEAVAKATAMPPEKRVEIHNEISPALEVSADRSHLYNILNNLVENAVKYSGESVSITTYAAEENGLVELRICDTGNGIPSGDLKHIFQRFYRGKASSGEQPGIGLGLAYVKLLTEAHGGSIAVESTVGEGTCFTIKLPQ